MRKEISLAKEHCANYNNGKCLGVMLQVVKGEHQKKLLTWRDKDLEGNKCVAGKDCDYYQQIVRQIV